MRVAGWALPALTGCAVLGLLYGASFPGEPSGAFFISALALALLFVIWCVVGIALRGKAGRRDRAAMLACAVLAIGGIVLTCTGVPMQLRWYTAQSAFEQALQEFDEHPSFGQVPHRIAGFPVEYVSHRAGNFVDFTYRNDENGWDGFAYSDDGSTPQTVHQPSGDYVIAWTQRLGPHWFAFGSYHTM